MRNGLTILTREDHAVPIVCTMVWYRVGSRFERPGITGISHFLEHMMFKGTERYQKGEIDCVTARQGGSNNAFTSNDYTAYYFIFASDRWWPALEIEADRMRNNLFDPQEFELERRVILEELKMELDNPWGALRQAVEIHSFETHPYRFPVIGIYEDLLSITPEQMIEHYHRFYSPTNATLVLVGDFHTEEVLQRVEQLFGHLPQGEVPSPVTVLERRRTTQIRLELKRPTHIPRMFIAFPAPSVRQKEHYALHILDKILSEGKLSRLYRRLIEGERVASLVTTEFFETYDPYLFFIRVALHQGMDLGRVEALIFDEIARLGQTMVSERELRRAKNQCLTQLLSSFETTLDQAIQLGLMETHERYQYWSDYAQQINQLTAEEIRGVAEEYWTPEQATVGILSNEIGEEEKGSL
ncbi:insulinase family protein [Acidobacteria bacterium AH-259-G07]|nr:insulinase family protein [Acidobacteria bacterium AH-259-G07]